MDERDKGDVCAHPMHAPLCFCHQPHLLHCRQAMEVQTMMRNQSRAGGPDGTAHTAERRGKERKGKEAEGPSPAVRLEPKRLEPKNSIRASAALSTEASTFPDPPTPHYQNVGPPIAVPQVRAGGQLWLGSGNFWHVTDAYNVLVHISWSNVATYSLLCVIMFLLSLKMPSRGGGCIKDGQTCKLLCGGLQNTSLPTPPLKHALWP